jgi:hypothetical protein
MRSLQSELAKRETSVRVDFDHKKHRIRCYAHIINICCSHIISSTTSVPERYLSDLEVPYDSNRVFCDDSDDESDDVIDSDLGDFEPGDDAAELKLDSAFDVADPDLKKWFAGIKRDPLRRARRMVRFLRASDQRKEGLRDMIKTGNEKEWFFQKSNEGKNVVVKVKDLQLLRDVKTRWDSVYLMLKRLRELRPVSLSWGLDGVETN